jgi:hypothetical protein
MVRPGIRRLNPANVPDRVWEVPGLPFGLRIRELNADPESGGRTLIVDIPPGWAFHDAHHNGSDEEFLVLDGGLSVGDQQFKKGSYLYRPAGTAVSGVSCPDGAQLLYWHDGPFDLRLGEPDSPPERPGASHADIFEESTWQRVTEAFAGVTDVGSHDDLAVPTRCIRLRTAEATGHDTIIFILPRGFKKTSLEFHHGTEELYFLSGWCATDVDHVYHPGEYLCWAPGTIHGVVQGWDAICISKHHGGLTSPNIPVGATGVDIARAPSGG